MAPAILAAVDFGPGGFIGLILVFILAALFQNQRQASDNRFRRMNKTAGSNFPKGFVIPKSSLPIKKQPKQPRYIIQRQIDGHFAVLMHRKGTVVEFFSAPCGTFRFTENQAQQFFDQYNHGSREGYNVETLHYD